MELTEAAQRILRRHLGLIAGLLVVGLAIPLLLQRGDTPSYAASTRVVIGSSNANKSDQAQTLADTAQGIVTSTGQVAAAVKAAKVDRDPDEVAKGHVKITPVGTSGVLELSVSDRDPKVAAKIANALADGLVGFRTEQFVGDSQRQLDAVNDQITKVDKTIEAIQNEATTATGTRVQQLQILSQSQSNQRNLLANKQRDLSNTIQSAPQALVLGEASPPRHPEKSGLPTKLALGGLLGLILGIGAAALLEALRPTIVSPDALARTLGAPVIGRLPCAPEFSATLADSGLPAYLRLAARGSRVDAAQLTAVGPQIELARLAGWLRAATGSYPTVGLADPQALRDGLAADPDLDPSSAVALAHPDNLVQSGIVVVAPEVLRRDELTSLEHLMVMTQWPLIGIISYRRPRFGRLGVAFDTSSTTSPGGPIASAMSKDRADSIDTESMSESVESVESTETKPTDTKSAAGRR